MDLYAVTQALNDLRQHRPHLPMPAGLARTVLTAWTGASHAPPDSLNGQMAAVVAVTWPIGAAAGAARGHHVATTAIRDMVAAGAADQAIDPQGRRVIWAVAQATQRLPTAPDTSEVTRRVANVSWVCERPDLDIALAFGLGNGWRAGHSDATDRAVDLFADHVIDLISDATLATTFLNVYLTGADVVQAIETAAFHAAQRDRDNPPPLPDPAPARNARPSAARAFMPVDQIDPRTRNSPNIPQTPLPGPGRNPGPSR